MSGATAAEKIDSSQLTLFEKPKSKNGKVKSSNGGGFNDPSFSKNRNERIHRWVPWIAGYSKTFVDDAIQKYVSGKGTVLDPFAGVGTSLVEAIAAGHKAIGFEINPYAALACRVKTSCQFVSAKEVRGVIAELEKFYSNKVRSKYEPRTVPPPGFKTRGEFYSVDVLRKVLIIQDFISGIEDESIRDIFRLAFASTMVVYSNYSYEPSLGQRKSAGKENILDYAVCKTVVDKLLDMVSDIEWFQETFKQGKRQQKVINDSFFNCQKYIKESSVDLLITSPPYLNNYHYNRNTRPHLYWLGYAENPKDIKPLEELNFGKFWQTVREKECVDLDFSLSSKSTLPKKLKKLRGLNKEKGIYGGNGWANYAASYFNDCYRFAESMNYALKKDATALIVIGNSILQGELIPTDEYLGEISEQVGLEVVDIHIPRDKRIGNSIIQSEVRVKKAKGSHQLYEAVVELRKR